MKKKVNNQIWILGLLIGIAACGKLEVIESDFSSSHLSEIDAYVSCGTSAIPEETLKRLFEDHGMIGDELNYAIQNESFYHSWQSKSDLAEFIICTHDGCEKDFIYFTYRSGEYVDSKIIGHLADCGDFTNVTNAQIKNEKFSITNISQDMGDLYESVLQENCLLENGKFICETPLNTFPGLSLWNGLALRKTPEKDGDFITRVNIGETFKTADSVEVSEDDEYIFVELKGGISGHILNRLVMPKAVPFAIRNDAVIYTRPDELTSTTKSFQTMDIVGLSESRDAYQWLKVKGRSPGDKWFKEGWIKSDVGTQNPIDIAVASLVNRALEEQDLTKRYLLLKEIQNNPDLQDAWLISKVSNFLPGM